VRVAPLVGVRESAPYLHNGSVPTLETLLVRASDRPRQFAVGVAERNYRFDTRLPGNRNSGHEFGAEFTDDEKRALLAYVRAIP
jgi:hypothetical protein